MSVKDFLSTLLMPELFKGMALTGGYLFRKKETVQYPEKRLKPQDRFRGMFGYSLERCIDCHLCAKACPIDIIYIRDHVEVEEIDGKKKKFSPLAAQWVRLSRSQTFHLVDRHVHIFSFHSVPSITGVNHSAAARATKHVRSLTTTSLSSALTGQVSTLSFRVSR